ncbi:MAG: glycosyl transferase family 1 [Blastocatellia bacterium AA13]|nr:MAG: glycosyl transferase family 1 [Blastocatellia bacterium AA13]
MDVNESRRIMKQSYMLRAPECFVGTYPPRECGIATFTHDLRNAILNLRTDSQPGVIAITGAPEREPYPGEVIFEIRQQRLSDYRLAAEYINLSSVEVVNVQHEFGIFGGPEGRYITEFLKALRKPAVTTLHTVLSQPPPEFRDALSRVASLSDHLVVLNSKAIPILNEVYGVPREKVTMIPHGVPDVPFVDPNYYKDNFGVEGRLVLLTFGLLSRNKGIEMTLEALPEVVKAHPEVVYIVLGATHPEVRRNNGEEYRLWLHRRVRELGLTEHVIFYDRYVALDALLEFIGACDIYVTPYQSKEQIVSGTLAYAIGMGKAVVSTPYLYAEELLSDGRGSLVEFGNAAHLSETLCRLIQNQAERHQMRKRAYEYGRNMIWSEVGMRYLDLFARAASEARPKRILRPAGGITGVQAGLPEIKLDHLRRMTDDTGIIQHATWGIPDRSHGYATDDAARALVVALLYNQQSEDQTSLELACRYLSFLKYAQLPDGHFHNFMNYRREFIDERGSDDTLGRALWGLGAAVALAPVDGMRALASDMFERAIGALDTEHPRAMGYAICGLYCFLTRYDGAAQVKRTLIETAVRLAKRYEQRADGSWRWFGDDITYANAKMPQAMLLAHLITGDERFKEIGLQSLEFLLDVTYGEDRFNFVGNQGWYRRDGERAVFGQQPIEAAYTAEACLTAYEVTGDSRYVDLARAAAEWLLGRNRLGARLYDFATGACADGLDPQGVSMNQGAESVICGLLTLLVVSGQIEKATESTEAMLRSAAKASSMEH